MISSTDRSLPETLATTPSRFARDVLGITPHPAQVIWLDCRAKIKVACCGRRFGKTYSESADLLWMAATRHGTSQFVIAPTHDQAQIMFRYTERLLRESRLAGLIHKIVYSPFPEIQLRNDSVIRARSAGKDATNVRGHGADRIVLDEAAFIGHEVYETISPMLATSPYGELVLISTPFGMNRFWEYWTRGQTGDPTIQSFRFPSSSNPHLSASYLEQQRRDMTALAYAVEYEAEFREDQNAVFPWSLIESCLIDDTECEPQPNERYVIGWDPAEFRDRSGVAVLQCTQTPYILVRSMDIAGSGYDAQENHVALLSQEYNRAPGLMDDTGHAPVLEHMVKHRRIRMEGYTFTNISKRELIENLVVTMEQGNLKIPRHLALLIDEMQFYRYEHTAAGNVKLGADEKHCDDLLTALALAVWKASTKRSFGMGAANLDRAIPSRLRH